MPLHAELSRLLARAGFLTPEQVARWTGHAPAAVAPALARLVRAGSLRRVPLVRGWGPAMAVTLAAAPAPPAWVDWCLARADLAERLGALEFAAPGRGAADLAPAGRVVAPADPEPVWLVLHARPPAALRGAVLAGLRAAGSGGGALYAPPGLLALPAFAQLPVALYPWNPPHLEGRLPLAPGWEAGTGPLTAAAIRLLSALDRWGYATARQLARMTGTRADVLLPRLERGGWIQRFRVPGLPVVWSATCAGLRAAGAIGAAVAARPATPHHTLALVDLGRQLELAYGGHWYTERELRVALARQEPGLPPPDGALDLPGGHRVLVQLELSCGKPAQVLAFASRHCAAGTCQGVWYVCRVELARRYRLLLAHDPRCRVLTWTPPAPGVEGPAPR